MIQQDVYLYFLIIAWTYFSVTLERKYALVVTSYNGIVFLIAVQDFYSSAVRWKLQNVGEEEEESMKSTLWPHVKCSHAAMENLAIGNRTNLSYA